MKPRTAKKGSSEKPIVFGRVIAAREYRAGRENISLQIGTPHRASSSSNWYCPVRIVRGGTSRTKRAYGIDPVQALELGLQLARILLQLESPKITFEGAQRPGDVGIDKVITSALGVDFAEEMERMLEKAYLARSRQLERHHKTKRKTVR